MKLLQGWKVKFYTFITLFLFVAGTLFVMWPQNKVTYTREDGSTVQLVKTVKQTPNAAVKGEATIKDPAGDDEQSTPTDVTSSNGGSMQTTPSENSDNANTDDPDPTPISDPKPTPRPTPKPIITPVVPPIIIKDPPYVPPRTCGVCGQLPLVKGIVCPMTQKDTLTGLVCRLEY